MTTTEPPFHTAEYWAKLPRRTEDCTVKSVTDHADSVQIATDSWGFVRSKSDLGRELRAGDTFVLETVNISMITGMQMAGVWLFHLTDEDLAQQAREQSAAFERQLSEELDRNHRKYAKWEAELPGWLRARIERFHAAAGDKFKREGWGYELVICRLAELLEQGREPDADALASELGATGNQWGCAKAIAEGRKGILGDTVAVTLPAGLAPITGSADYT